MRCDHPNRFGVFASLPLPDIEGSLREIAYALDELKSEGIGLLTNYDGKYPGDPAFAPVFEELNRRKAVVYFHPAQAPCCAAHGIGVPAATLDFPFDTTKAITSMLFAGTFARCRDIRFIFSHAGGTVPFLAERIARLQVRPEFRAAVPDGVMFELKRLFFDTALSANELAFSALLKLVAPDQVLFGSDYPFAPETTMTATVKGLAELGLPAEVLRAIERTNALKLLGGG
jgi:predicted TIM-barrel fold metal-dependent hydrolase